MKKKRILFLAVFLILSTLFSACATMGAQDTTESMAPAEEPPYDRGYEEAAVEQEMAEESKDADNAGGNFNAAVDRMVIYNAYLEIAVEDPEVAMQSVIDMAERNNGFVVSSNLNRTYTGSRSLPRAYLTIRVPAGQLNSIMDDIKALTPEPKEDVIAENVSGEDVTAEFTDLESRLRNLEAAEEALVELMEEARDPEDVLNIFDELTYYRGEIEVVKGRMQYIEESVALSAITVEIIAKESLQPIEIGGWKPEGTVKRALERLIEAGQWLVDAAIWFGIFCLPFLIPLGVGAYFLVKAIRKHRANKKAKQIEEIETIDKTEQS